MPHGALNIVAFLSRHNACSSRAESPLEETLKHFPWLETQSGKCKVLSFQKSLAEHSGEELKRLEWDQDGSRKLRGDGLGIKPPPVFMSTLLPFPAEVRCTCSTSAVANWHNGPASLFQEICGKKALELKQSLYI